jgi:CubicO group peptidase (beta-lactamase class C family)
MDLDRFDAALDRYVPDVLAATHTPGLTVALADSSGLVYSKAFGLADISTATPMRTDHVMPGGSLSKPALTVTALQLAERGGLSLHRPVVDYTALPATNPLGGGAITAYHFLTHQSGLAPDTGHITSDVPPPLAQHVAASSDRPTRASTPASGPAGPPRSGPSFGNAVVGHIRELTDPRQRAFPAIVAEDLFEPLGLSSSTIPVPGTTPDAVLDRVATGYARCGPWCVPSPSLYTADYPATGILTTAEDYVQFLAALLLPTHRQRGALLAPSSVYIMAARHVIGSYARVRQDAALGLALGDVDTVDAWLGGAGQYPFGWHTLARALPRRAFAMAVFANAWDLTRFVQPLDRSAPGLIANVITAWIRDDTTFGAHARLPWRSSSAYAAGFLLAERISALLNAGGTPLSPATIARIAADTRRLDVDLEQGWDATAFAAGTEHALAAGPDPRALERALLAADVDPFTLGLVALTWGATASTFPVPMDWWARRRAETDSHVPHLDLYRFPPAGGADE